jgi:predicted nuclease of predicted toxin-antitoxin system
MMIILVDENIPLVTVNELRRLGHDVSDIRGTADKGMSDELLWKKACDEHRLLITTDKGFSQHRNKNHNGILIITLRKPNTGKIHARILQALKRFSPKQWHNLLVVMRDEVIGIWRGASR